MGGNLFKLGRLPRQEYLALEAQMRVYFEQKFGDLYRIPRYYGDKADFGDMDVILSDQLLAEETSWEALRESIVADLGLERTRAQGGVFSTVYQDFQVDYFIKSHDEFLTTHNFMSFNDLGNIVGKIYRRFNLKYGEKGLMYVFRRDDNHYKKDLIVSRDPAQIFGFLGLEIAPWEAGFDNLEAIFSWVTRSPFFSVAPYRDQSATTRRRKRRRQTMERFVAWLDEHGVAQNYEPEGDAEALLAQVHEAFPQADLLGQIAHERRLEEVARQVQERFNGRLVMSLRPELQGAALGDFIKAFKAQYDDFDAAVLAMTPQQVIETIKDFKV